jgi:hypothetical protein
MTWEFEREHFRIQYPARVRPEFLVGQAVHEVLDLSEGGIRLRPSGPLEVDDEGRVAGTLRLRRGESVEVEARMLRRDGTDVVLRVTSGITFRVIMEEQRWLLERSYGLDW